MPRIVWIVIIGLIIGGVVATHQQMTAYPTDPVDRINAGCEREFALNPDKIFQCKITLLAEKGREIERAKLDRARR